jgi:hypothetical protein
MFSMIGAAYLSCDMYVYFFCILLTEFYDMQKYYLPFFFSFFSFLAGHI